MDQVRASGQAKVLVFENLLDKFFSLMSTKLNATQDSLSYISKQTGISRLTLRNIRSGHTSAKIESYRRYKLFTFFFHDSEILSTYSCFSPLFYDLDSREEEKWDFDLSSKSSFTKAFGTEMSNPVAIAIYTMSLGYGVRKEEVQENFGKVGVEIANRLVFNQILLEAKDIYYAANTSFIELPKEEIKNIITSLSKNYNINNSGQNKNYINFRVDKVNHESLQEIQELHAEFDERIKEILRRPESKGDVPFYTINQMDIFSE